MFYERAAIPALISDPTLNETAVHGVWVAVALEIVEKTLLGLIIDLY